MVKLAKFCSLKFDNSFRVSKTKFIFLNLQKILLIIIGFGVYES